MNLHMLDMAMLEWLKPRIQPEDAKQSHVAPCAAHKGFYLAYNPLRDAIIEGIGSLNPTHIYVTGHSLGGALLRHGCRAYRARAVHPDRSR